MQNLKLLIPLALFLSIFFVACHEEDPFENGKMADVSFVGRVIDENGDALEGAHVKAGKESTVTDVDGIFRLQSVRLPAGHAMVSVSKAGYFEISRPYIVEDDALQTITIQLLEKNQVGSLIATAGGLINVPGGPSLNFPANAVTDANGNAYSGTVRVFARYLDPSDRNLGLFIPGDMTAETTSNEEVFLATYGMVGVEIESTNGQKLKIASGQEVELRMPILASQLASAPSTIQLWHYDLEDGHWHEEGSAQKVGNEYVGKVTHFSFWNCDAPFPLIQLHGKIYLGNTEQPLANAIVRITMLSTGASSFGYTNENGCFGGCIPKDEALTLEVVGPVECGSPVLYTQNIGPFSAETTLAPIMIPLSQISSVKIIGQLQNCTGQSVANGYVKVELADSKHYLFPGANGQFEYTLLGCGSSALTGELTGYDLTNLLESSPTAFSTPPNTVNIGSLVVCSALSEFIQYTLDGQSFTKVDPFGGKDGTITFVASQQDSSQTNPYLQMSFANNGQVGTFPLLSLSVNQLAVDFQASNTLTTTMTSYGNPGGLMIGTFGGNFQDFGGASHTISGSYRVIRDW
ncbi:MAG: carboxypeptidase-like regulatory domain-containing protein [Saprospiraceae bacterium]